MDKETIYAQWKEQRRQIPVPDDFAANMMNRIESLASGGGCEHPPVPADVGSGLMQWSTAAGLVLLGLFRVVYILTHLLRANALMPY